MIALQWHYRILQALALDEDLPELPEDKTIPRYRQIDKVCFGSEVVEDDKKLTDLQRAGDYVLAWSEELDAQSAKLFGGPAATKSNLAKRGPKGTAEGAGEPPTKRVKAEGATSDLDDEIRRSYEKGTIAKVSPWTVVPRPVI